MVLASQWSANQLNNKTSDSATHHAVQTILVLAQFAGATVQQVGYNAVPLAARILRSAQAKLLI